MKQKFNQKLGEEVALQRMIDTVEVAPQPDMVVEDGVFKLAPVNGMYVDMIIQKRLHGLVKQVDRQIAEDAKNKRTWVSKLFDDRKEITHGK